jgi:hypothetical protein
MIELYVLGLVLAAIWGAAYAVFLQTYPGRFLAARLTWLSVVIGVGVDAAIVALVFGLPLALLVTGIIGVSAGPIVLRSLINEMRDQRVLHHGHSDQTGE